MNPGPYPPLVLAMLTIIAALQMDTPAHQFLMLLNASAWIAIASLSLKNENQ